jgi:Ser-tRNA(Ala) deacylase AlaX
MLIHQLKQESTPRIVRIGDNPGCPCGGTHVLDISDITKIKVCNPFTTYSTQQEG